MRVEYHPAVEPELAEILKYYEGRSPGLGSQFIDEFDRQIAAIATAPDRWKLAKGDIRRCLMQRFPYIIYFRSLNNNRIRILLVRHQKRHPAFGSERR